MRGTWVGLALLAAAASLAGCSSPSRPVVAPTQLPVPVAPSAPTRTAAPAAETSRWSFGAGESCRAEARSASLSLTVTVSSSQVQLTVAGGRRVAFRPRAASIAFTGRSGAWTMGGRAAGRREVAASMPLTEDAASRVLVLLDGGVVRVGPAPPLRIPGAGVAGRDWFKCVRRQLLP